MTHWFTKSFQEELGRRVEHLLNDWYPDGHELAVGVECVPFDGWSGVADIWVAQRSRGRIARKVLNIEIEHFSGVKQAMRNVEHVVGWAHRHPQRKASVLHLINMDSNLTDNHCTEVLKFGRTNRSKQFDYDFTIYQIEDQRSSRVAAKKVAESYDFQSRVFQHLHFLDLV